jgi:hypothetical protein
MPLKNLVHVPNILNYKEIGSILRKETVWQSQRIKGYKLNFFRNIMTSIYLDIWELIKLMNLCDETTTGQKWERMYINLLQLVTLVNEINLLTNNLLDFYNL